MLTLGKKEDLDWLKVEEDMISKGAKKVVFAYDTDETTSFENKYEDPKNLDKRTQRVFSKGRAFKMADVKNFIDIIRSENPDCKILLTINSLWMGEFPEDLIPETKKLVDFLAIDA